MCLEAKGFPIEEGLVSSLGLFQVTHAYTHKIHFSRPNLLRSSHRRIILLIAHFRRHKQIFITPFIPNPTSTVNVNADLADCRLITTKGLRDCEEGGARSECALCYIRHHHHTGAHLFKFLSRHYASMASFAISDWSVGAIRGFLGVQDPQIFLATAVANAR